MLAANEEYDLFTGQVIRREPEPIEEQAPYLSNEPPSIEETVWRPIEGTTQYDFMEAPYYNEFLLAGGRGWGKTDAQLMKFRALVGVGYGTYWRGVIFDREYKNLDDLVVKSRRLFMDGDKGQCHFLSSKSEFKWVWDTGEELLFRVASTEDDYWLYHGHEYPFIGWNELTKYPTGKLYSRMRSVNRSGFDPMRHTPRVRTADDLQLWAPLGHKIGDYATLDRQPLPPIPLTIVSTTNPYGAGHNWVKSDFIDDAPYKRVQYKTFQIFNPRTQKEETVTRSKVAMFGTFKDNPFLSPEYVAGLMEETDENILKAWVDGDWDIVAGGAFDDVFRRSIHILPRFKIPRTWKVDRTMDWGSSHPASIGWWAECNGEEARFIDRDGRIRLFCPPRGTLIQIAELYYTKKIGTNEGLKKSSTDIAKQVKAMDDWLLTQGWIGRPVEPGPADNQISDVRESDVETIEHKMLVQGVSWERSDKSPGSRKIGLELARDRFRAVMRGTEEPGLYFMDNCKASIATIPVLPRDDKDPEDVDTEAEDHPWDMCRYRVLKSSNRFATVIKLSAYQ